MEGLLAQSLLGRFKVKLPDPTELSQPLAYTGWCQGQLSKIRILVMNILNYDDCDDKMLDLIR